jgi:heme-degrading monooxygenase HmoA
MIGTDYMKRNAQRIKELIISESPVYSATFIFRIKKYDSEFERLNNIIDEVANYDAGFLGKESWSNEEKDKRSVIYYWNSLEALTKFSNHPDHQKAKRNYDKWYSGYEIIISKVLKLKSDDGL